MNPVLTNTTLRELPEYLIQDYLNGRASESEIRIVESLMNLPVNRDKIRFASENLLTKPEDSRVERLMNIARTYSVPASRQLPEEKDVEVTAGQIWSVSTFLKGAPGKFYLPIAQTQYVFILTNPGSLSEVMEKQPGGPKLEIDDEFVEYLPVSMHTELANQYDMIIPAENSILGVEFMIETEINSTTLCSNLENCFGALNEEETEKLLNLYFFTQKMGHDYELLSDTQTGTEHYDPDSTRVEYKKIEFQNSQIISEPVDGMVAYLEELNVVVISHEIFKSQHNRLAAATSKKEVEGLVPSKTVILHKDSNIFIAVNEYKNVGYFFNVIVAADICPGEFTFRVVNKAENTIALERKDNAPDEHFFPFYEDFKSGIFDFTISCDDQEIFSGEFLLALEV